MAPASGKILRQDRQAVAVLEFMLLAPLLFALVLAVIDFGWLVWSVDAVQETATVGARCMGVLGTSCTSAGTYSSTATASYVQTYAQARGVTVPANSITLNNSSTCGTATGFSKVTISYQAASIVPDILRTFAPSLTMNVSACFPNQPS